MTELLEQPQRSHRPSRKTIEKVVDRDLEGLARGRSTPA